MDTDILSMTREQLAEFLHFVGTTAHGKGASCARTYTLTEGELSYKNLLRDKHPFSTCSEMPRSPQVS